VHLPDRVHRVALLETAVPVQTVGPDMTIHGDEGQLEKVPINLVRNAATRRWRRTARCAAGAAVAPRW
jgi:hypothetical protein